MPAIPTSQEFAPEPGVAIRAVPGIPTRGTWITTDRCVCAAAAAAVLTVVEAAASTARRTRSGIGIPAPRVPEVVYSAAAASPCHRERMLATVGAGGGEIVRIAAIAARK
jgi:hypothetical protein